MVSGRQITLVSALRRSRTARISMSTGTNEVVDDSTFRRRRITSKWSRRARQSVRGCRRGARLIWHVRPLLRDVEGSGSDMSGTAGTALLSLAIQPRTMADQERLAQGLQKLMAEDPTIGSKMDQETGQTVISVMGEWQLETIIDRLKREFNVEASLGK